MTRSNFKSGQGWFKQLFESSPDPTWIIDGNRFVECNDAAVRALGYTSREALLNVHPSKLSPPKQPDGQDSYVKAESMMAIAKDKGLHRFEWMHTRADGTNFDAEVTLSIIDRVEASGGPRAHRPPGQANHLLRLARHHRAQTDGRAGASSGLL